METWPSSGYNLNSFATCYRLEGSASQEKSLVTLRVVPHWLLEYFLNAT